MKIVVSKLGAPLDMRMSSAAGTELDVMGIMKAIPGATYVGPQTRGGNFGIPIDMTGVDEFTSAAELEERVPEVEADLLIHLSGYRATWSYPDNPAGALVQANGIRYTAFGLIMARRLKVPRVLIVTDPKCYPRDGEMTVWPECIPSAVLSQEDEEVTSIVQGKAFRRRVVRSGCEYWSTIGMKAIEKDKDLDVAAVQHSHDHAAQLRYKDERALAWDKMCATMHEDKLRVEICGQGWKGSRFPEFFIGKLKTFDDVMQHLARGKYGLMTAQKPGFNSTKIRLYALAGNCPLPYGTGKSPVTYDSEAQVLPLDHPARVREDGDVKRAVGHDCIEEVLDKTTPNTQLLTDLISDVEAGKKIDWQRYGGYRCLQS